MEAKSFVKPSVGLPNTCSGCGKDPGPFWYAANKDMARSGQGLCDKCRSKTMRKEAARARADREAEVASDAIDKKIEADDGADDEAKGRSEDDKEGEGSSEASDDHDESPKKSKGPRILKGFGTKKPEADEDNEEGSEE